MVSVWIVDFWEKTFKSNLSNRRYRRLCSNTAPTSNRLSWVVLENEIISWPALGCFFKCVFISAFGCLTKYTDIYSRYIHDTTKKKKKKIASQPNECRNFPFIWLEKLENEMLSLLTCPLRENNKKVRIVFKTGAHFTGLPKCHRWKNLLSIK